jgi:DegV family protein with EDD domain
MSKIALVTDSTTYMPPEIVKKYDISVAPQVLIWGDQTYKDGVDIEPREFFTRLQTAKMMPTTSQVSVVSFQEIFQDLVNRDMEVLALLVSSKLSGTIQSAMQAKDLMGAAGERVHVVDSQSVAMALGFQVLAVARAVEQGAGLKDAIALAEPIA